MHLAAAPLTAHSARRGRQQTRPQRRTAGGARVYAAIQERRGTSPPRNRGEPEKDDGGISLFGKRLILRVEPEEQEPPPYYDDEYDEPRRNGRRPAARVEEKKAGPLDGLLSAFAKKDERDDDRFEDPYDRFVREERQGRFTEREGSPRRRSSSNRSPSPRPLREELRRYEDDYSYDDRSRSKSDTGSNPLVSGLSAFAKGASGLAEKLSQQREEEVDRSPPRRMEAITREDMPRRRLVRRDDEYDYMAGVEEMKKPGLKLNRRAAIATVIGAGGAVAAAGYVGTGTYQKNVAMGMAMDMVDYEDALAERKKYLFLNLAGCESVLEVGVGTGPNMTYYPSSVEEVVGVDTNEYMRPYAEVRAQRAGKKFKFVNAGAEDMMSVPDSSVDAVVSTIALCSVRDPQAALEEISRVLRPGGAFLFIEHVAADASKQPLLALAQRFADPFQQLASGGCHLTRDTGGLIRSVSRMVETPEGIARWGPAPRSFLSDKGKRPLFLFDRVMIEDFNVPGVNLISPHVSGIAFKPELDFL